MVFSRCDCELLRSYVSVQCLIPLELQWTMTRYCNTDIRKDHTDRHFRLALIASRPFDSEDRPLIVLPSGCTRNLNTRIGLHIRRFLSPWCSPVVIVNCCATLYASRLVSLPPVVDSNHECSRSGGYVTAKDRRLLRIGGHYTIGPHELLRRYTNALLRRSKHSRARSGIRS